MEVAVVYKRSMACALFVIIGNARKIVKRRRFGRKKLHTLSLFLPDIILNKIYIGSDRQTCVCMRTHVCA